jgi:signal transduction histidine kinase
MAEPQIDQAKASLEQQVAALQQQLTQAQRLTALGELVGTTTHEFNNILMTVINYAKMGLRHKDEETRDKALGKILAAGERAAKLTSNILGMARNRSTQIEPTNLDQLITDSLMLLEREMRKYRISVEYTPQPTPRAMACGNQIQQVLLNLLINARQALQEGGQISIRLVHDPSANTVDLIVRDNGCGIPADKLPKIFDSFYSTKEGPDESGKGGTGLGLSACRNIIQAHQGKIRVESTPGQGTAFTIKLPAAVESKPFASDLPTHQPTGTLSH